MCVRDHHEADGGSSLSTVDWREHRLRTRSGEIALHEAGDGPPLVFLHGGPGQDHRLIRTLAEPLTREYRCILPDQRGSGGSAVESLDADTLHINRLIEDIEDLRQHLGQQRLRLIGWSWGAALALLYGAVHPDCLEQVAAIAPGPIPWELLDVYHANRVRSLTAEERTLHADLSDQMERALRAEDAASYRALNRQLVALSIRAWFYSPEQASAYLETYLDLAGDTYNAALISDRILGSLGEFTAWDRLGAWEAPTLVLYGYQDFEPITQAYTIQQWAPQTQIVFLNECGHYPWLEQPDRFYAELHAFLESTASSAPDSAKHRDQAR